MKPPPGLLGQEGKSTGGTKLNFLYLETGGALVRRSCQWHDRPVHDTEGIICLFVMDVLANAEIQPMESTAF